jgi:pyruvate kinase
MDDTTAPLVAELRRLTPDIAALVQSVRDLEAGSARDLARVAPGQRDSARNLVHYLALRRQDLRDLQDRLAAVGLSSLGRAEPAVADTLRALTFVLARITGERLVAPDPGPISLAEGRHRLAANTEALLGPAPRTRHTRIMVTLPSEAADDPQLARELVRAGMNLARINCAHDGAAAWQKMVAHVRAAATGAGIDCRILMDLAGPKLRTGALPDGPRVLKLRPRKNACGVVIAPARAWLTNEAAPAAPPEPMPTVPVRGGDFLAALRAGDRAGLEDARGARRQLDIVRADERGCVVLAGRTTYLQTGTRLRAHQREACVGLLPAVEVPLVLAPGDRLALTRAARAPSVGLPAIPCTVPEVFADVRRGERILFDDGEIGGRIAFVHDDYLEVEIVEASPRGSKLRADRGINLPDSQLRLRALDATDLGNLDFIAAHADLVGYSFVRRPEDVLDLQERLAAAGRPDLGIVLKIETRDGFEQLPRLLLAAMRRPQLGVMIARGDLAVECGWERLAEIQEEVLWVCEAAHAPVIWATQVLEKLSKEGQPSRAEITDAAMGVRAECVMLNKGPHVVEAVRVLDDILHRMEAHHAKKRPMLRALRVAERFASGDAQPAPASDARAGTG